MPSSSPRWFGVKTLFRSEAGAGAPTLVEERVVLVRARTPDEATRVGEEDATKYAGAPFHNRSGELVRRRYLGACATYELFGDDARRLGDARGTIEVFSDTRVVAAGVADEEIVAAMLGAEAGDEEREVRWRNFVPGDLAAEYEGR